MRGLLERWRSRRRRGRGLLGFLLPPDDPDAGVREPLRPHPRGPRSGTAVLDPPEKRE